MGGGAVTRVGLYGPICRGGEIDHGAWLRAHAEGRAVGDCRRCGQDLMPLTPENHGQGYDYQADCRDERCGYTILAPRGRVYSSAFKSQRTSRS